MGFYDVEVNDLSRSIVSRATGITTPTDMQVRTWFRDYANGFIEQMEEEDLLNMASELGWFVAVPLRLDVAAYLQRESYYQGNWEEELSRRLSVIQMLVDNGFIDPDWATDPSGVRFRVDGDTRMLRKALDEDRPVPFGFNFLASDQMVSLGDWPFLYLETCRPQDANSPDNLHHGESFRDWLEDQEGMDRIGLAIRDSPLFYSGRTATHHIDDDGVAEIVLLFDPMDFDPDFEYLPHFQVWPTQVAPQGQLPYSYTRWGITSGDVFTGNMVFPSSEGLDTWDSIYMSMPEAESHMTFFDRDGQMFVMPRWSNLLLCTLNRSITTVSDRFRIGLGVNTDV